MSILDITSIYLSELELKDTTLTSNEVCYLDTRIRTGDNNTPFHLSVYNKRDDFSFRIVNFPYIDSNIPANPAYGVYISQLMIYARICTSKLDFIHRLGRLSTPLLHQGFKSTLLGKLLAKFFKRHDAIIEKYGITLREMRLTIHGLRDTHYSFVILYALYHLFSPIWLLYSTWYMRARNFSLVLLELCLFS